MATGSSQCGQHPPGPIRRQKTWQSGQGLLAEPARLAGGAPIDGLRSRASTCHRLGNDARVAGAVGPHGHAAEQWRRRESSPASGRPQGFVLEAHGSEG